MSMFEGMRLYPIGWKKVATREFTDAEKKAISEAKVVPSNYGRSVCFMMPSLGKVGYIALEPIADVELGDILDLDRLRIVSLEYEGTDTSIKVKRTLRIKVLPPEQATQEVTFENPFGI